MALALLLLAVLPAQAFSLFPGRKEAIETHLRRADALLARADAAYEAGATRDARRLYAEALERYETLNARQPDLHDGLPRFRVDYCRRQLASLESMENASAARPGTDDAAKPPPSGGRLRLFRRERRSAADATLPPAPQPEAATAGAAATTGDGFVAAEVATGLDATPFRDTQPDAEEAAEPEREPPDPALIAADLREARVMLEDEQLADATRILVGVLRADPGNRSARLMIALARARQGRHDEALVALEDLRGQNEDLPLLLALSAAYCGAGRFFDALLVLDKAIKLAPADPHAYLNLAWLHLAMDPGETGRRDAEAYYRRAVRLGVRRDRALEVKLGIE